MSARAEKTDPKLWEKVKGEITKSEKGGKPGQWSARKAQMASSEYKKKGGGYRGEKSNDNHLKQWTEEAWGTKSGAESGKTGERYLPKKARASLSDEEYTRSTRKKRSDAAKGKQHSQQPRDVAKKAASARKSGSGKTAKRTAKSSDAGESKAQLMEKAKARNIAGRSRMLKGELQRALGA